MQKNITYLLGAGASYHACPIWKEQAEKMVEMAETYLPINYDFTSFKRPGYSEQEKFFFNNIGYFGLKGIEYGSVDVYAKKLIFSDPDGELRELRQAICIFFAIWESIKDSNILFRHAANQNKHKKIKFQSIDKRYLSLLASVTEKSALEENPRIKENIKFVSWNYDMQLESAFKSFCNSSTTWNDLSEYIKFHGNHDDGKQLLDICHLNGYSGFLRKQKDGDGRYFALRLEQKNIVEELIPQLLNEDFQELFSFSDIYQQINFAWEDSPIPRNVRNQAKEIFSKTDILVIIGYSFPPFNKEIDKMLFEQLKGRKVQVVYQDPFASEDHLRILCQGITSEENIKVIRDMHDHFYLPYEA